MLTSRERSLICSSRKHCQYFNRKLDIFWMFCAVNKTHCVVLWPRGALLPYESFHVLISSHGVYPEPTKTHHSENGARGITQSWLPVSGWRIWYLCFIVVVIVSIPVYTQIVTIVLWWAFGFGDWQSWYWRKSKFRQVRNLIHKYLTLFDKPVFSSRWRRGSFTKNNIHHTKKTRHFLLVWTITLLVQLLVNSQSRFWWFYCLGQYIKML